MKTRSLGIALAGILVLLVISFAWPAWRAHRGLVTLPVRNATLAAVVRSIEWQTWQKIEYDRRLNGRLTLNVEAVPLERALDLVAARTGARWQKTYAVYTSGAARHRLESVLQGGPDLAAAGWTNLAPQFPDAPEGEDPMAGGDKILPPAGTMESRRELPPPGGPGAGDGPRMRMMTTLPNGVQDTWSQERLVLETAMVPKIGPALPDDATDETAAHTASSVGGKSQVYYALAPLPPGMRMIAGLAFRTGPGGNPGSPNSSPGDIGAALAQQRRDARLAELANSPEEQVDQARQGGGRVRFQVFGGPQ